MNKTIKKIIAREGANMKKMIIIILLLTTSFLTYSYGISDTDFVAAKSKVLYAYKTLETNALQISLIFEQEVAEMSQQEQALFNIIRGDLELGMFTVREILGLYTLQGAQISTPSEAVKLLTDASLDSIDYLNGIQERLRIRVANVSNKKVKNIVAESLSVIEEAKKSISVLQEFTENRL